MALPKCYRAVEDWFKEHADELAENGDYEDG